MASVYAQIAGTLRVNREGRLVPGQSCGANLPQPPARVEGSQRIPRSHIWTLRNVTV